MPALQPAIQPVDVMNAVLNKTFPVAATSSCRKAADTEAVLGRGNTTGPEDEVGIRPEWVPHFRRLLELLEQLLAGRDRRMREAGAELPDRNSVTESAAEEYERVISLEEFTAGTRLLLEVEEALRRIREGSYGRCEMTGAAIPEERLAAIPWTRFAGPMAAQLERGGPSVESRLEAAGERDDSNERWLEPPDSDGADAE
jgi:RNA polymerase-binding transcription factor DksA